MVINVSVDIWVHTYGDMGFETEISCGVCNSVELSRAFNVEALNAGSQCKGDVCRGFGNAGKDDFFWVSAGSENAQNFAAAHAVKARA